MQLGRSIAVAGAAGLLWLATSGAAQAQTAGAQGPFPNRPYRIKFGGYMPRSSRTRDAIGYSFPSFGLGYDFKRSFFVLPVTFEGYVDYFDRVKNTGNYGRSQARVLGGGVTAKYNLDPESTNYRPYFGLGVGLYTAYVKQEVNGGRATQRRTTLGGKLVLGAETRGALFGEIDYNFVPHPSIFGTDVSLSGFQARIGARF